MSWGQQVFNYCERGQNPAFWAEPLNAISNAAFFVASMLALLAWVRLPDRSRRLTELGLIGLVGVIGVGSFMFHTMATRWSAVADAAPIGVFMLGYTGYALRRFLSLSWRMTLVGVGLFAVLLAATAAAPCPLTLRGLVAGGGCLNGSVGYLPAIAMLLGVGLLAHVRSHGAAHYLLVAAVVFAASLTARTLDFEFCGKSILWGQSRGTHVMWHLLNAVTLGLLLMAAVKHGRPTLVTAPHQASTP